MYYLNLFATTQHQHERCLNDCRQEEQARLNEYPSCIHQRHSQSKCPQASQQRTGCSQTRKAFSRVCGIKSPEASNPLQRKENYEVVDERKELKDCIVSLESSIVRDSCRYLTGLPRGM